VIRFGRIGDMVLIAPLLNRLHRRYGLPCWLIGAGPWSFHLYRGHADIARICCLAGRHTPLLLGPSWWRVLWELRSSGQSPVYVCESRRSERLPRIKSALALAGVSPERCVFLEEEAAGSTEHRIDSLLRFGAQTPAAWSAADFPCPPSNPAPNLQVLEQHRRECDRWIAAQGWAGCPIVLVQPGNRRSARALRRGRERIDGKAWSVANWSALLRYMHDDLPQAVIVLCGSPREQSLLQQIRATTALPQVIATRLSLCRLLALCEVAHSMVSVDTGPAHVAAAVGSPLVVLFGDSSPHHWCPRSGHAGTVISLGGAPGTRHVNQLPVSAVLQAWRSLPTRPVARAPVPQA
jgi:heptosyltransferase-2/heptosyltransferase-3